MTKNRYKMTTEEDKVTKKRNKMATKSPKWDKNNNKETKYTKTDTMTILDNMAVWLPVCAYEPKGGLF